MVIIALRNYDIAIKLLTRLTALPELDGNLDLILNKDTLAEVIKTTRKHATVKTAGHLHTTAPLTDHLSADQLQTPECPSRQKEAWIMADSPIHYTSTGSESKTPQVPAGPCTVLLNSSTSDTDPMTIDK